MTPERSRLVLSTALPAWAGYVDAIGFLQLGGVFVSFMSGNTTRLGVAAASGAATAVPAAMIGLFVVGVVAGHLLRRAVPGRRQAAVLAMMTALLLAAAALGDAGWDMPGVGAAALAMGVANAVFEKDGQVSVGATYVTGTLVKLGDHIADALAGGPALGWIAPFVVWASLAVGSVAGGFAFRAAGLDAIWAAATAGALLTGWALAWPASD